MEQKYYIDNKMHLCRSMDTNSQTLLFIDTDVSYGEICDGPDQIYESWLIHDYEAFKNYQLLPLNGIAFMKNVLYDIFKWLYG